MIKNSNKYSQGIINGWTISVIGLSIVTVSLAALSIWLFVNYNEQKTDVDTKIKSAVATAKKDQSDTDEIKFDEREKSPNREFVGPDDYGRLTFDYPKTWSVYVAKDSVNGGVFEAYLNPLTVPTVSATQQFALRVLIEQKDYDKVISSYDALVKKGDLKSSNISVNNSNGIRFDGFFNKNINGSVVHYKIRDKTLTIRTDASVFKEDFDKLITTIKFNQ